MRTTLYLLSLGITAGAVVAQAPPPPPAPPRPSVVPAQPSTPRPTPRPLIDHWLSLPHFELTWPHEPLLPSLPDFELTWPHEPLLPHFELTWPHEPLLPSLPDFELTWPHETPELGAPGQFWFSGGEKEPHGRLSQLKPEQGSPEDSLFRAALAALNRGEYSRATTQFESFVAKYPRSRAAPTAYYWSAFALYRAGSSRELETALTLLKTRQQRYPEAAADPDAATLRTRLYSALAARGNAEAATALRAANAQGATCDREEMEVRAEALSALAQLNTPEARPTLMRVLARRDECSVTLRRRAVYILGRSGTEEAVADLVEAAKSDPDAGVQSDAVTMIGRSSGANTVKILEQIFNESTDERVRNAALSAIRSRGGPEAKRALRMIIERTDVSERARIEAIQQLGRGTEPYVVARGSGQVTAVTPEGRVVGRELRVVADEEDAAFLRGYYTKTDSRNVKRAIIAAVARIGGPANEQWLLALAKNKDEDITLRRDALSRIKTTSLSIDELGKLFDALSERELRYAVVSQLASREDPAAVDKLIEIAKSGTDPQVRRQAIAALSQKKDPRTLKLLLELVEKP